MPKPGSALKFERAYQHLLDAQSAASQFLERKPYDIARDEQSEPGKLLFWITLLKEPPAEIALAAGDAIHNMRSALDHMIYELSSKSEPSPEHTAFPVLTEETYWDKRDKRRALKINSGLNQVRLLADEAKTFVQNVQPWARSEPFEPDLWGPNRERLRELHSLDIRDKHMNLNLAVFYADMVAIGTDEPCDIGFEYIHRGPLQLNTRTLLVRLTYPAQVHVQPIPKLDVVFSEGLTPNEPIGGKLGEIFRNVGIVLDALSRFA